MNTGKSAALTMERIRDGMIQEGQAYEFKRLVNLDDPRGKSNLIDDVVAFLNAGAGHLIIGVGEKIDVFERLQPLQGDKDVLRRRLTSIIQDSIDPKPMKVLVEFLDIDGENYIVEHRAAGPPAETIPKQDYRRFLPANRGTEYAHSTRSGPFAVHVH